MEPIESSETSAYINTLTPGTYPKEKKLQNVHSFTVNVNLASWLIIKSRNSVGGIANSHGLDDPRFEFW